jgi:hypothetical protein
MSTLETTPCAYCPRLCRHACPVATATGAESAVTATIFAILHAHRDGREDEETARGAASLCLGCGACTAACVPAVPVAARLRAWRGALGHGPVAEPLGGIEGDATHVCVMGPGEAWADAWSAARGLPHAILRTTDSLAHASWVAGEREAASVLRHAFEGGRVAVVASLDVAEVLEGEGIPVERLPVDPRAARFRTCFEGPEVSSAAGQLACCGRREGFASREPEAAREVARANVRILAGAQVVCADQACATWLREHGGRVVGPADALAREGSDA